MGFGWPTRYIQLEVEKVEGGSKSWDGNLITKIKLKAFFDETVF
jgi:hypothetical protein